jgi:undecaprenyl-diphosphatase
MHPLFDSIIQMDRLFFAKLNSDWTHPILDSIMPILTDLHRVNWLTHYALPVLIAVWLFVEKKKAALTLLGLVVGVGLSDSVSYHLVKNNVKRERPEFVMSNVELRTHSHSGYSFPSNHTANVFAAALVLRYSYAWLRSFVFLIAMVVGYSRVYLGVHFPLDVAGGAFIGLICAFATIHVGVMLRPEGWKYQLPWFAKRNDS